MRGSESFQNADGNDPIEKNADENPGKKKPKTYFC